MRAHDAGPGGGDPRARARGPADRRVGRASCPGRATRSGSGRSTRWVTAPSSSPSGWRRSPSARSSPSGSTRSWAGSSALTLVALGVWVMYSVYRYARAGERFRLRSRWMLVFDAMRYGWRRFQARIHGHEHVEPLEMSSYGARTSFGVGMIHGVGAETGTQVLLIAAVGGASSAGLGVPMLFAFVIGLLISNFAIVMLSSVSFVSSQAREQLYVAVGAVAGAVQPVRRDDLPVRPRGRAAGPRGDLPVLRGAAGTERPQWRVVGSPSRCRCQSAVTVSVPFIPSASCEASRQT